MAIALSIPTLETVVAVIEDAQMQVLAAQLWEAERSASTIAPITETYPGVGIPEAYLIQRFGRELRVADGAKIVGRKVGLTSAPMQQMFGVDEPDFGYLTEAMVHDSGVTLSSAGLIAPRVEAEVAFRMTRGLSGADVDLAAALDAIEAVAPAIEIVDSRITDWRIKLPDTVADNASSGIAVIGAFRPLGSIDLAAITMQMRVRRADGAIDDTSGRGDAVLGHPAQALAWLVQALAPFGEGVDAGQVVIPGAMAAAVPVLPGDRVDATFSGIGDVSVTFDTSSRDG